MNTRCQAMLMLLLTLLLFGCEQIPTHNLNHDPLSITADGQDFVTCEAYGLSNDSWFGNSSYTISFTNAIDHKNVTLRSVKKLAVAELPTEIDAPMPSYLPDVRTDHPSDGSRYVEGATYTWTDGTKAMVKNGVWHPVKQRNTICDAKAN